jgi:hypothetical protein
MEFYVKQDAYNKKVEKLVEELPLRVQSIIDHFPEMIAELAYQQLLKTGPKGIQRYPKMLRVRQIEVKGVDAAAAIIVPGYEHSHRLRTADVKDTVLYVKPREYRDRPLDPGAVILSRRNPWTMTTLPYEPQRQEASIKSKKVSAREARKIEARRKKDLPQVKAELKEAGVVAKRPHPTLVRRRVTRDIAFEVLRKEFGINTKHQAHWRPAIRAARRKYVKKVLKKLVRWLTVPSERRWETEVMTQKEKASTVRRVQGFQDHIAAGGR